MGLSHVEFCLRREVVSWKIIFKGDLLDPYRLTLDGTKSAFAAGFGTHEGPPTGPLCAETGACGD